MKRTVTEVVYLKRRIGDINVNSSTYKLSVLKEVSLSKKITPQIKSRLLATAVSIVPNSFKWVKSWDKGKIYRR